MTIETSFQDRRTPAPHVVALPDVIGALGLPRVNEEGLAELFYGELGVSPDRYTSIRLRGRRSGSVSAHWPGSYMVEIDPMQCREPDAEEDFPTVLLGESQRLADELNNPGRKIAYRAGRVGAFGLACAATYAATKHGVLPNLDTYVAQNVLMEQRIHDGAVNFLLGSAAPILGGAIGRSAFKDCVDPEDRRVAQAKANQELRFKYADIITFPDAPNQ
jgi:hypothetical protein